MSTAQAEKKPKAKGPFRTGILIPFILLMGAIIGFNILFLDSTLRRAFEFIGSKINGAEVNISSVATSFKNLSIQVDKVEFTDPAMPARNRLQIGKIYFGMLWDALLRGKFVIPQSEIADILLATPRKRPGYVPPPGPPSSEENKLVQEALVKAKQEFQGNVIGDIADILSGGSKDQKLGDISQDLKSRQHLKQMESFIQESQVRMNKNMASLPKEEEFNNLQKRFKAIDWNGMKNIQKAPQILKEADSVKKDTEKAIKAYDKVAASINEDLKKIKTETGRVDDLVAEDLQDLSKRLKLPSLDVQSIAMSMFGSDLVGYMEKFNLYKGKVEKYLPPKKDKSDEPKKIEARPRGEGRNYAFGTPNSYPLFWLKGLKINSQNDQGSVKGSLVDLTNDQKHINKVTQFVVEGDFPGMEIRDVKSNLTFDSREEFKLDTSISVAQFPVPEKKISNDEKTKFNILNAKGNMNIKLGFVQEKANFNLNTAMSQINYQVEAADKVMKDILGQVAQDTQKLTLDASATGKLQGLKWQVKSNLAQAVKTSADRYVQKQIDAKKAELKNQIEGQIAQERQKVQSQLTAMEAQFKGELEKNKKKLQELTAQIDNQKKKMSKNMPKGLKL